MSLQRRLSFVVAVFLLSASPLHAQSASRIAGHWEGAIQTPEKNIAIEIDFVSAPDGGLAATIDLPGESVKGLPLSGIALEGASITFQLGKAAGERVYRGVLSAEGAAIIGELSQGGYTLPFALRRTGEARAREQHKSAAVAPAFEGTWQGTLDVKGQQVHLALTVSNNADGTASGTIVNIDEGGLEVPVSGITQVESKLTVDIAAVGSSYVGSLSSDGLELIGSYTQGPRSIPLTLRRQKAKN